MTCLVSKGETVETLDTSLATFFQWLLKVTLQGSLLVCLILLIKIVLRERLPTRWHYCLWLVLLMRLVLPWAPQSRLSIYNLIPRSLSSHRALPTPTEDGRLDATPATRRATGQDRAMEPAAVSVPRERPQPGQGDAVVRTPVAWPSGNLGWRSFSEAAADAAPWIWLAGCLVLSGYVLLRAFLLWWTVRSERPVTDQSILDLLEDCKLQMRVRTLVGVVVTDKTRSPALFGFVRPRILLPEGLMETLGLDELHYVFLHELAHLRRRDIYLAWLVCLIQVLHWFNPLLWYAFRRIRADQEMATDALALSTTGSDEPSRYGQTIVTLLERFSRPQYLPSLAGVLENRSHIERRIAMIAKCKNPSYRVSVLGIVSILVLTCVALPEAPRVKGSERRSPEARGGPTLRRVIDCTANAAVSPDNRLVCYPKYDDSGEFVVHSLDTGKEHVIKASAGAAGHEGDPLSLVFSPDGRTVAYTVADEPEDQANKAHERRLCLINADGTNKRVLCRGIWPIVWSSDSKKILGMTIGDAEAPTHSRVIQGMTMGNKGGPTCVVWVSTEDGSIQKRAEFPTNRWQAVSMSPDERYLAFDQPQEGDPNATWYAGKWDVFALDLTTGHESAIVRNPAREVLLGWAPSGKYILFLSDRMGTWDAWMQPVTDGAPVGQAQLVSRNVGHVSPGGFAQDGSYFYQVEYNTGRIYVAEINVQTGEVASAPKALEGAGYDQCWDWSPDGRFAAYISMSSDRPGPVTVHIREVVGGSERTLEFDPRLSVVRCLRWTPDGKSLLASGVLNWILGADGNRKEGIDSRVYRIDVHSGKNSILMQSERRYVNRAELSKDGKTLFYSCSSALRAEEKEPSDSRRWLVRRDLDSGQEKSLFDPGSSGWFTSSALSPAGDLVAIALNEKTSNTKKIIVIPSVGGQPKELVRWDTPPGTIGDITWTSDAKGILFVVQKQANSTPMELWHVSLDVPEPRKIMEADLGGWGAMRVHPDGRRIAFGAGRRFHELWVMENFLSTAASVSDSK